MNLNRPFIQRIIKVIILPCVLLLSVFLDGCLGPCYFRNNQHFIDANTHISIDHDCNDSITVHYIGCAGLFIQKGDDIILIDPYFSYKAATVQLRIEKMPTYLERNIDNIFTRAIGTNKDVNGRIEALLLDHAHVDHFGDVPWLFKSGHLNNDVKVIGNTNVMHYLDAFKIYPPNLVPDVEDCAASNESYGQWIPVNDRIRVLPIVSEHGPHAKILGLIPINLASKKIEKKDKKHLLAPCYGTGHAFAYLIDFLDAHDSVIFRIYHNSASSNKTIGLPPASVLDNHPVDLAILCAASFHQVKRYPEDIICALKPQHIVFSHWEEFLFNSLSQIKQHPTGNYFYNYKKLFRRTDKLLNSPCLARRQIEYTIPNVDTRMTFRFKNDTIKPKLGTETANQ